MGKRLQGVVLLGVVIALGGMGCGGKKKTPTTGTAAGLNEAGLAEQGSLGAAQQGRRPPGDDGGPLKDIHFPFDSYELDESARNMLRENGNWLKDHRDAKVEVEGHCDERGTVEYNLALGAKRARAAKEYLVTLGVGSDRLTTISYGEELPLCHEHNEDCWQQNRRAHFVVLGE